MTTTTIDLTGSYADSVENGLIVTQDTLLTGDISAGVTYINQSLVNVSAVTGHVFTASKDTYVDVGDDGVITYTETVLAAGDPGVAADAIRLSKVVTDATTITTITDQRTITVYDYVFGEVALVGTAMEVFNSHNFPVMIRFGSASTADGMPIDPYESRDVDEAVYIKPVGEAGDLQITG